jgi:predicted nucleic acid-binding Zn ribbon protein
LCIWAWYFQTAYFVLPDYIYKMTMRGENNRPLREWLQVFVQSPQLREKLYQTRIEKLWDELMGPMITQYTRKIRLDNQVLILYIDSASLKSELTIMKAQILTTFNEKLGEDFIRDVRIF